MSREFGDFQTPIGLTHAVLTSLTKDGIQWQRVLEPTCGAGSFIQAVLRYPQTPANVHAIGIEIQTKHVLTARTMAQRIALPAQKVEVLHENLFDLNLKEALLWHRKGELLIIGNPPWVTNAELGKLGSHNLPIKSNLKGLVGLSAITGEANFDIAEFIWIKLITELAHEQPVIALLCKTSVARNVIAYINKVRLPVKACSIRKIDAQKWFEAAVDACLFTVQTGTHFQPHDCPVYTSLDAEYATASIGVRKGHMIADIHAYEAAQMIDGLSPLEWRQGIKHDAASVMELRASAEGWANKSGQVVNVESEHVFPLLKSTDLHRARHETSERAVIVTQRMLGAATQSLAQDAPSLWRYLQEHQNTFNQRKSSIYRGQPPFAMFGIGDYSFAPYKIAVSGLHSQPSFRLITPLNGKPVMLDDTCYFIPCKHEAQAQLLLNLLNSEAVQQFLRANLFSGAKRPITKRLLQRIDLRCVSEMMGFNEQWDNLFLDHPQAKQLRLI